MNPLHTLFEPKTVALIGSSKIKEKIGMTSPKLFQNITYNMEKHFKGKVYVIDVSKQETIKTAHLAVIMLPSEQTLQIAQKCAQKGVKTLLIITGGFKNHQRKQLLELKEKYGTRILGPNTIMGVINTANGLNTTFTKDVMPPKGNIAIISQSGGVGAALLDWACHKKIGISKIAFTGDKIDINDTEILQYLEKDSQTKVICLYMEGIENGRQFIQTARQVANKKPILALKGGTTQESAQRALSHTASISGSDAIFNAAFKKAGIIRVEDIEELLGSAVALAKQPPLRGNRIAIVSNVGGPAILAADAIVKNELQLANLSEKTREEIERIGIDATNPIDLIADARAERYSKVLDLVLSDSNVDGALVINMLKSCFFEPKDAEVIPKIAGKYPNKPVVDVPMGGEDFELVYNVLCDSSIPLYDLPEKAAKALKALRKYGEVKAGFE
ncbi:MAG: CoA-binding protein [Candidatus Bathyarchaeia archaeon]